MPTGLNRDRSVLAVLCVAAFMAALDLFIVNVAFKDISQSFSGESLANQSWVLNGYAITYAALLVPFGRVADQRSRKAGFLLGLAVFTAASLACALAPSLWFLVAARVAQAAGAAALTPTSLGLVVQTFTGKARSRSVRVWAASGAIASAAGPVLGGFLVEVSWRLVFLINIPIGVIALIIAARVLVDGRDLNSLKTPKVSGAVTLTIAVGATALALVQGEDWGWTNIRTVVAVTIAVLGGAAFAQHVRKSERPLIERSMLEVRTFRWANVSILWFGATFAGFLLVGVLWMQIVLGYSAIKVGLCVAPGPLLVPVFAVVASQLHRIWSSSAITAFGCITFAAGCILELALVKTDGHYASQILPGLILVGIGTGLAMPELLATASQDLPEDRSTTGSAIVNMSRQLGSVIGVSAVVAILPALDARFDPTHDFKLAWWACAAMAAIAALAALPMRTRHERRRRHSDLTSKTCEV